MRSTHDPARRLAVLFLAVAFASCSLQNREGVDATCADLQGGLVNACNDGIITSCLDGKTVRYEVCENKGSCEGIWQTPGAFVCNDGEGIHCPEWAASCDRKACIDVRSDPANCGVCGGTCDPQQQCTQGECM